eukprot:CAMPEP_0179223566 /NCGR_PEP_ID=MMETSP0797-20121207/7308_1 /TAXON_ID=47934 /ORGANISM="Dinophysis acuminata, Strain DAEP01" /LENGTH=203 /DNA_ID=CAMNT_0020930455 /DNA_START=145 /DNA_END=756 /DNA_ORIENTATION=+
MTGEKLAEWVNFNRFPPVADFAGYPGSQELSSSQIPVVTLVHNSSAAGMQLQRRFGEAAKGLRSGGKYLFATINATDTDLMKYVATKFPLLSPWVSPAPYVFVFAGTRYWESPSLVDPENVTLASIEALMSDEEALQDGSWRSWAKEKRKTFIRLGTGSFTGFLAVVIAPAALLLCCRMGVRALLADDEAEVTTRAGAPKKND